MKKYKKQEGAISLFVLISMLFFLVFMLGTFSLVSRRSATQMEALKETKELYKSGLSGKDMYDSMISTTGTVIPITNKEQLIKVLEIKNTKSGTANYMINGKMYTYTADANYILQNNIILDLKDEIDEKNNITIYDYMLYTDTYDIETNGYDIYYAQKDGSIWKCVCYQNMGTATKQNLFSNTVGNTYYYGKSYHPERYSILQDGLNKYKQNWAGIECFELMLMYNSNNKFDTDSAYNRWRQTNNPATETKTEGSTVATGYNIKFYNDENNTNVSYYSGRNGIKPSDTYWGGLMQTGSLYYYLNGGMQTYLSYYYQNGVYYYQEELSYYYPVGKTTFDAYDGYYGINVTTNVYASECLLFVRVK